MYPETSLVATGVILPLVGVVAVCFRFFVRMRPKHVALGIDDWAILVACILVCGMGALQITGMAPTSLPENKASGKFPHTYQTTHH